MEYKYIFRNICFYHLTFFGETKHIVHNSKIFITFILKWFSKWLLVSSIFIFSYMLIQTVYVCLTGIRMDLWCNCSTKLLYWRILRCIFRYIHYYLTTVCFVRFNLVFTILPSLGMRFSACLPRIHLSPRQRIPCCVMKL